MTKKKKVAVASQAEDKGTRRPNPIDVHVGSRVRLQRMLLSMSQEKLGEQLGLTFQQVQKYEKGVNRIGASRLFDLSRVLGVPVSFFYDEAPGSEVGPRDWSAQLSELSPAESLPTLAEVEAKYIQHVMEACQGNKSRAAEFLGLTRKTLYRKLDQLK